MNTENTEKFRTYTDQSYNPLMTCIDKTIFDMEFLSNRIKNSLRFYYGEDYDKCVKCLQEIYMFKNSICEIRNEMLEKHRSQSETLFDLDTNSLYRQFNTMKMSFRCKRLKAINLMCAIENDLNDLIQI